jgi:hypothetical protein
VKPGQAKKLLRAFVEENGGEIKDEELTVGQLIAEANHFLEPDRTENICPFCGERKTVCRCEAPETEVDSLEKVKTVAERRELRDKEEMPQCPICWSKRFKEHLYETENVSGNATYFGCTFCLEKSI